MVSVRLFLSYRADESWRTSPSDALFSSLLVSYLFVKDMFLFV